MPTKPGPPGDVGPDGEDDELARRVEALGAEVSRARAEAAARAAEIEGAGDRRDGRRTAGVLVAGLAAVGVVTGLIVAGLNRGKGAPVSAPVTSGAASPATSAAPASSAPGPASTTTVPASTTTGPASPTTGPAQAPPAPAPAARRRASHPAGQVEVRPGDSFWIVAQRVLEERSGRVPTTAEVGRFWVQLVGLNSDRLVHPGNPNLIYPGQTMVLPSA